MDEPTGFARSAASRAEIKVVPHAVIVEDAARQVKQKKLIVLINGFFFLLAGFASVWLLWVVFSAEGDPHWTLIAYVVALWAILAYLLLPRIHKVLTALYLPNYFIGRSRTTYGVLGDPINVAFNGSADNIHRIMQAAGWTLAEPISFSSSMKIIAATLTRKSYPTAPVSTLQVFDRTQDFAYQQEIGGSPGKRHHIRFWHCPPDWPLPGGRRVDWVAAGTYDRSVGLSLFTLQVTHKIGDDIDGERDHVIDTLRQVDPGLQVEVIEDFSTAYHARNGGGDRIQTDGDLPIVDVQTFPSSLPAPDLEAISSMAEAPDPSSKSPRLELKKIPRPAGVYASALLIGVMALSTVVNMWTMIRRLDVEGPGAVLEGIGLGWFVFAEVILLLLLVGLAWGVWNGYRGARLALVMITGYQIAYTFILWIARDYAIDARSNFVSLGVAILLLLTLTSTNVTDFALARVVWRRERRAHLRSEGQEVNRIAQP